jgi:ADP-heptose:LPS heptosyltransferase
VSASLWAVARRVADGVGWLLFGGLGLAMHLIGGRARFEPHTVRRILVIRLDLLGDLVFALPAVQALRAAYPQAELTLLTLETLVPGVDRVLALDLNQYRRPAGWRRLGELLQLVRQLRAARFDLCIVLHGRPAGILALLSGARYRVGYAAHAYPFAFNRPVAGRRYTQRRHEVEYCLALARAAGAEGPAQPQLPAPPGRVSVPGLAPGERYVVLHPGASNGSAKRWPAAAWARLAEQVWTRLGVRAVVTGSAAERELVERVVARGGAAAVALVGAPLQELVAVLAGAEAVVAGDTGPAHTGPRGPRAAVVRRPVACGPCYDLCGPAECKLPERSVVCMRDLGVDGVLGALLAVLGHRPAWEAAPGAAGNKIGPTGTTAEASRFP